MRAGEDDLCRRSLADRCAPTPGATVTLLLDAAVRAFANDGADVTLDAIAKSAGVGIGTLYRHFPTRDALVEAAYRQELAHLCEAVPGLLRSLPPDEATRTWMDRFIDYMTTKRYMAGALQAVIASGGDPYAQSRGRLIAAITALLDAGVNAGTLRSDVDAQRRPGGAKRRVPRRRRASTAPTGRSPTRPPRRRPAPPRCGFGPLARLRVITSRDSRN